VAFVLTTFLTLFLTTMYSVSLMLLMFFNFLGKTAYLRWVVPENLLSILRWVLPVKTLPVRSIGMVAGALVFVFVAAFLSLTLDRIRFSGSIILLRLVDPRGDSATSASVQPGTGASIRGNPFFTEPPTKRFEAFR